MSGRRADDARLDALIHDATLRHTGVVEPDEPTAYSHAVWMEKFKRESEGEFSAAERCEIRARLGIGPFASGDTETAT